MSKAYNSPTARLLQSSRLFSLPRPLPPAALETPTSTGSYRASETATAYYPTRQAITTPSSSHFRGDWGLKRAIPGKTTKSSTPSIRLLGQDTPDHITDFESAADHERSREKFAELGVHITTRDAKANQSVYEDFLDNTDPDVVTASGTGNDASAKVKAQRWKYSGPWIAGMQEGEFQRYLDRQLASRKDEWTELVVGFTAEKKFEAERRAAQKGGRHFGPLESARPSMQGEMSVEQAEREARSLYSRALETGDDEQEAEAKRQGEVLIAHAREVADRCQLEEQRWAAPGEAQRIMTFAERKADVERTSLSNEAKRLIDSEKRLYGEELGEEYDRTERLTAEQIQDRRDGIEARRAQIDPALSRAAEEAGRVLETTEQATYANIYKLIRSADDLVNSDKATRTATQIAWETSHLASLRPAPSEIITLQRDLREGFKAAPLGSDMANLIVQFLDIPPVFDSTPNDTVNRLATEYGAKEKEKGPPSTHPGAGLSYLRTNAIMENHPTQGPLTHRSAIQARVLAARNGARGPQNGSTALLGLAGFTAADSKSGAPARAGVASSGDPTDALDATTPGGGKLYVHPLSATIDETGRVVLKTVRADEAAIAVKTNEVEDHDASRRAGSAMSNPVMPVPSSTFTPRQSRGAGPGGFGMGAQETQTRAPRAGYGTGLYDRRQLAADEARYGGQGERRAGVRGFGGGSREGQESRAYEEIARLGGFKR